MFRSARILFNKRAIHAHPAANPWGFCPPATSVCEENQNQCSIHSPQQEKNQKEIILPIQSPKVTLDT